MAWELKNAQEDVDIRSFNMKAFEKLPLGSYFEDILNLKTKADIDQKNEKKKDFQKIKSDPLLWLEKQKV
jgi:hypothetical protein